MRDSTRVGDYVIVRVSDGKFVSLPGSKDSYTSSPLKAIKYKTREIAEKHLCPENEKVLNLRDLI